VPPTIVSAGFELKDAIEVFKHGFPDHACGCSRHAQKHNGSVPGDLTGAYRVLTVVAGMAGDTEVAAAALAELSFCRTIPRTSNRSAQ
jgi:hypothetical protein